MSHLTKVIDRYIAYGDPSSMKKVRKFLSEKYDFDNLTPEYIKSFPLLTLVDDIGYHLKIDVQEIQNEQSKQPPPKVVALITL